MYAFGLPWSISTDILPLWQLIILFVLTCISYVYLTIWLLKPVISMLIDTLKRIFENIGY
jgi:hypothetical protein